MCEAEGVYAAPISRDISVGDFYLRITGNDNVPMYQFYSVAQEHKGDKYLLKFNSIYECDEDEKPVGNKIALSSLDWAFGPVLEEDGGVHFTMKSSAATGLYVTFMLYVLDQCSFKFVEFDNHLKSNASAESKVKFDVAIDTVQWKKATALLCMDYRFHSTGKDDDASDVKDGKKASVGDANFQVAETAEDKSGNEIRTRMRAGSKKLTVMYDHFDGSMMHDPELDIGSASWVVPSFFVMAVLALLL